MHEIVGGGLPLSEKVSRRAPGHGPLSSQRVLEARQKMISDKKR
jgi:hypothetical protein